MERNQKENTCGGGSGSGKKEVGSKHLQTPGQTRLNFDSNQKVLSSHNQFLRTEQINPGEKTNCIGEVFKRKGKYAMGRMEYADANEGLIEVEEDVLFHQAFQYSGIGMAILSISGQWLKVNPVLCNILGYAEEKLQKTSFQALTHPDDLMANKETVKQLIAGEIPSMQVVKRYLHARGHYIWGKLTTTVVRSGTNGAMYYLSQVEDITERMQYEEKLFKREQEFRTLVENSDDIIVRYGRDFCRLYANPAYMKFTGFTTEDVIGSSPVERSPLPPRIARELQSTMQKIFENGQPCEMDMEWVDENGTFHCFLLRATPEFDDKKTVKSILIIARDISERRNTRKQLIKREEEYRTLIENSTDNIIRYNGECKAIYANDRVKKSFRGHADDLIGHTPKESFSNALFEYDEGEVDNYMAALQHTLATGEKKEIELHIIFDGKNARTHNILFVPEKDADGNTTGAIAFGHDITDRKEHEQYLKDSFLFVEKVINSLPAPVFIKDNEHRFVLSNDAHCKFICCTHDELIGKTNHDFYPEQTVKKYIEQEKLCFETGKEYLFEEVRTSGKGEDVFLQVRKKSFTGSDGQMYLAGTIDDVTKLKNTEKTLLEEQFRLSEAQRIGRLGSWGHNFANGEITFSDELNRIYEIGPERSTSTYERFLHVVHPGDRELVDNIYLDSLAQTNNTPHSIEHRLLLPDGRVKYVVQHWENIFDTGGKPVLTRGTIQDITTRKEIELELIEAKKKSEESNRLKSAFLATISHELRTPLNQIVGFSQLLVQNEDHITAEYGKFIRQSGNQLLEIFEDMIGLSLIEHTSVTVRNHPFLTSDLFTGCKNMLSDILEVSGKKNDIDLVFKPDPLLLSNIIISDTNKINQVLANLFKNAVKFTNTGCIKFGFYTEKPGWVTFYVRDTGIGIPAETLKIIFDLFRQGDDSHTREYGGVGIGLAISRKIADLLKCALRVESEANKGSIFYLDIPAKGE